MKWRWLAPLVVVVAACAPALPPAAPPPASAAGAGVDDLVASARATARRVEQEPDAARRLDLVATEIAAAQACIARAAADPRCDWTLAIALGQQARERPSTANDGLAKMVEALRRVIAAAPELEEAGGHRVLALVLLRAPGWPLGPGDPEEGFAEAERAVAARPDYPPNQLALGEALAKSGRSAEARQANERARELAAARERAGDPDAAAWRREAERALGFSGR